MREYLSGRVKTTILRELLNQYPEIPFHKEKVTWWSLSGLNPHNQTLLDHQIYNILILQNEKWREYSISFPVMNVTRRENEEWNHDGRNSEAWKGL